MTNHILENIFEDEVVQCSKEKQLLPNWSEFFSHVIILTRLVILETYLSFIKI